MRNDELRVDLFYNNELYKANALLTIPQTSRVDLLPIASAQVPGTAYAYIQLFHAPEKPVEPILWLGITKRNRQYALSEINEMKKGYVAINITRDREEMTAKASYWPTFMSSYIKEEEPRRFGCAMCPNKAHLANLHSMNTFCSVSCHNDFLNQQK